MLRFSARAAPFAGVLVVIGVYAFDAGHGFVKDDFQWILTSRVAHLGDLGRLFGPATGFFRPLVSLSFAFNYALFDVRPLGYGLTNLVLLMACAGVLVLLLRSIGLRREVALAGGLVWALNFQGINMAVLWISGRTALLVTLFATAAAWAWTRQRRAPAALLAMAAMWSKEEAFVLPAILTAWSAIDAHAVERTLLIPVRTCVDAVRSRRTSERVAPDGAAPPGAEASAVTSAFRRAPGGAVRRQDPPPWRQRKCVSGFGPPNGSLSIPAMARAVLDTWPLWLVAAVSLACRTWSGAYTPASAPESYRYQFDLATLAANGLAYVDRAATTPVLTLLVFWLAAGLPRMRRSSVHARSKDRALKGAIWLFLALTPTMLLPVRSSLYAVLPSVGVMLILGDLAERIADRTTPAALRRAMLVLLILFIALVPVYRSRNVRFVKEAELSAAIVGELSAIAQAHPDGGLVVIKDLRDARPTAEQAFGPLADRAALLMTDGKLQLWIDPPPSELTGVAPPDLRSAIATVVVERGTVRRSE